MAALQHLKAQVDQTVNSFFEELLGQIEQLTLPEARILELERREEKICKGSVKALIQHYADDYKQVTFPRLRAGVDRGGIEQLLRRLIGIEGTSTFGTRSVSFEANQGVGNIQFHQPPPQQ